MKATAPWFCIVALRTLHAAASCESESASCEVDSASLVMHRQSLKIGAVSSAQTPPTTELLYADTSCAETAVNLGTSFSNVDLCAEAARADPACGDAIQYPINNLWSKWGCKCCSRGENQGATNSNWNVYSIYFTTLLYADTSCAETAVNLGTSFSNVDLCAEAARADPACGGAIQYPINNLWSKWGCKCCSHGEYQGATNSNWNVYSIYHTMAPTPSPTPSPTLSPTPYPTPSPTPYPTPSPTPYPTPSPTPSPTPAPDNWYQRRRRSSTWPDDTPEECGQATKQKSMYAHYTHSPSLEEMPTTNVSTSVLWQDWVVGPYRPPGNPGGVYASWVFKTATGNSAPGGYYGAQVKKNSMFLFSVWDGVRFEGGDKSKPVPSDKLAWPLDMTNCKRNCQDCGLPELQELKEKNLTTGAQCKVDYPDMDKLGRFDLRMERLEETYTIYTADYGGMGQGHNMIGEYDRNVTGSLWRVSATDAQTGIVIEVGKMLLEGGPSIRRLTTFDEMLGCNKCHDAYHMDTRFGPILDDRGDSTRVPIHCSVEANQGSSCTLRSITGNALARSVTFQGGPGAGELDFDISTGAEIW